MIVPGFPGISLHNLFSNRQPDDSLPFPLHFGTHNDQRSGSNYSLSEAERNRRATATYYFFARNGIYHGLRYFGIQPGDEVLMPELNSTIEPQVVRALGAKPIFYKIKTFRLSDFQTFRPFDDFTPDWDDVSSKLSSKTKFFHLIHYLGVPNDIERALEFCKKYRLIFFEDAAYGFLSNYQSNHNDQRSGNKNIFPERSSDLIGTESKDYHTVIPGIDPESKQQTKKQKKSTLSDFQTFRLSTRPLGSFGDFSILCPRKTVPVPNGGVLVINSKSRNTAPRSEQRSTTWVEISKYPYPPVPPLPSSIHPLQSSYSSLWDWQYLLRNNPDKNTKLTPPLSPPYQGGAKGRLRSTLNALRSATGYVFHGSGSFDLRHVNWGMTRLSYNQLFKFYYPTIIQKNLENYRYVRDYCVNHGWDIFPREIKPGTVPNAILLKIPSNIRNLKLEIRNLRETNNANDKEDIADKISNVMKNYGIELARPWHWNENITTLKALPSVDAYVGCGLILPIHYQLNRSRLDNYLSLLSDLLK